MQENHVPRLEEWVDFDPGLNQKETDLFESELSIEEQAREALRYLVRVFDLPQTPLYLEEWEGEMRDVINNNPNVGMQDLEF